MRLVPEIFEAIQTGNFTGNNKPNGRVTVLPYWQLHSTPNTYGDSIRGPFRYYTDGTTDDEYEIPSVKSITWDRSLDQDIGTCEVQIYNTWHEANSSAPELAGQLGKPGFFWPLRGQSADSQETWDHTTSRGAYKRDGTWEAGFSWNNVLVEDVVIKTFEGYAGAPSHGNYTSIDDNLSDGNIAQTGVWIVDSVTGGSDGTLTLRCRDIGRILLDQITFPPLVPGGVYPLEYYLEGKSPFDSFWGPKVKSGVLPASHGEVKLRSVGGSGDSDTSRNSWPIRQAIDGDATTYALSNAYEVPDPDTGGLDHVFFEFAVDQSINSIAFTPWAGGYDCYVSVRVGGVWQGSEAVPNSGTNYIKLIKVPMYVPDGSEQEITVQLRDVDDQSSAGAHYEAERIRLSFKHLYYSGVANASGHYYRAGLRDLHAYRTGSNVSPYSSDFSSLPWTFAIDQHPTRGYWVMDDSGNVYGFGDAADYDSSSFGAVPINSYSNNIGVALTAHPDGKGYWALDWRGHVWAYGSATDYGEVVIADPYVGLNEVPKAQAMDICATHTGDGYWVVYSNGVIYGFGDANDIVDSRWNVNYTSIGTTAVAHYMDVYLKQNYEPGRYLPYLRRLKSVAIQSHPNKLGFWVTDGSGQVWSFGQSRHHGQLVERKFNTGMGNSFRLEPLDWASAIESTVTGNGYWIIFASGKIASFGDAVNQGPVDIYEHLRGTERNIAVDPVFFDYTGFRYLTWGLARDPDGSGFWVLTAAGEVLHYDAEFWGQPGYQGKTGYRWHAGNWSGDYMSIVQELLMWAGFLFYDASIAPTESPSVLGGVESTGIKSDSTITGENFDKKPVIDVIRELIEVVGYCVDDQTEILTDSGWKLHNELSIGDFVLSLNPDTGFSEWKPVTDIYREHKSGLMYAMENRSHSSLTTSNHRWLVKTSPSSNKIREKTTETLTDADGIIRSAEINNEHQTYPDWLVELAAWYWTEGNLKPTGTIEISQSGDVNPEKWQRIYNLLLEQFGQPGPLPRGKFANFIPYEIKLKAMNLFESGMTCTEVANELDLKKATVHSWIKNGINDTGHLWRSYDHKFMIHSSATKELLSIVDSKDKIPTWEFIKNLTAEQARLFVDISVMGDGWIRNDKAMSFTQKNNIDRFSMACAVAGYPFSWSEPDKETGCEVISVSKVPRLAYPLASAKINDKLTVGPEYYSGVIWCPEVQDNHSWFARRNGKTYYTGNTFYIDVEGGARVQCVDEETEILTSEGWKKYNEVHSGDMVLSLDRTDNKSTWTKVDKMNVYNVENEELILMEGNCHSSLTTKGHRWWTYDSRIKNPRRGPRWKTSETLRYDDAIPIAVEYKDAPTYPIYYDDFVALIGWWMSEGHQISPMSGYVSQSHIANTEKTNIIRGLLTKLYGKSGKCQLGPVFITKEEMKEAVLLGNKVGPTEAGRVLGHDRHSISKWMKQDEIEDFALWSERKSTERQTNFHLSKYIMKDIHAVAPNRIPTMEFLFSLTSEQLDLLYEHAVMGDGNVYSVSRDDKTWGGYTKYYQPTYNNLAETEVFEILCALRGVATSSSKQKDTECMATNALKNKRIKPVGASMNSNGATKIERVNYTGKVWCPTLEGNHVWLAKRDGKVFYTGNSPNWWSAGNFDLNGERIYVEEEGSFVEVDSGEPGATLFIPLVHESVDMLSYSATLSSADKRSELIIGTEIPDPKNRSSTQFIRYVPPPARDEVHPGVPSMRNIVRQGIWSSQIFELQEERRLMAELIGLHAWFAQRTGSVSIVGNPCLSVDDQVRLVERNTSETYIHRIQSISSSLDNDAGSYSMNLTTHWLGTADNWVITTEQGHGSAYGDSPYVSISERVDSWQSATNRGLAVGGHGTIDDPFEADGDFTAATASLGDNPSWGVDSESALDTGYGDDNRFVNFMMFGNGVDWPFYDHATTQDYEDGGESFRSTYLATYEAGKEPILTFALAPEVFQDAGDAGPDTSDPSDFIDRLIDVLEEYTGIARVIVWRDFEEIGYDISRYVTFFDAVYTAVKDLNDGIEVFGPNVNLAARSAGYDTSYNGVTVDSRDMDLLQDFYDDAAAFDGIAISGEFSDSDWGDLIDYIKYNITDADEPEPLIVSLRSPTAGAPSILDGALDGSDIALWPSGTVFEAPSVDDSWTFDGTLTLRRRVENVYLTPDLIAPLLGESANFELYQGASLIQNFTIYEYDENILLGNLGVDGAITEYTFVVSGTPVAAGTGRMTLRFHASSVGSETVSDTIVVVED